MRGRAAKAALAAAFLAGFGAAAFVLTSLAPLELPELAVPSRIYARPYRIAPGLNEDRGAALEHLRRLGYREVAAGGALRPGELQRKGSGLRLAPRAAHAPVVELRFGRDGRVASVRDTDGRRRAAVELEPEVIGAFRGERLVDRELVPLEAIPGPLIRAVLTLEDRRFHEHFGLDPVRLGGAVVANLRAGRVVQGGSTLTQQLVKNLFLDDERTLARKLREAWLALRVERGNSKREILASYLNTIYLGQRGPVSVRGVAAGARHYFGKRVGELTLAESALLAGLIRGPGLYSPFRARDAALERRNRVLEVLREAGTIPFAEYAEAVEEPLGALDAPPATVSAPYFSAFVERELEDALPSGADALEARGLAVYTGLDARLQSVAERAVRRGLERLEADFPRLAREGAPLQAALLALDPARGDVLALVGGRDWGASQFDRATQARRQPGSVFKPVVALAALRRDASGRPPFTLASLLADEPLEVETRDGTWTPTNEDDTFGGPTPLRVALERSINVPIARLGLAIGPERIVETARRLGIESRLDPLPSLALGAFELSPLEIARAYAVLAASGARAEPRGWVRVVDIDGRPLAAREPRLERAFDPAETALVTSALRGAVERGTATALRAHGFRGPVAGKTGTTNGFRDAWFVGYTPGLVAAVWVGFDDGAGLGLPGSRAALPIFSDFVTGALGAEGGAPFPTPEGVEWARVHAETGLLASWTCPGEREVFLAGTVPTERCGPRWLRASREPEPGRERPPRPRRARRGWTRILDTVIDILEDVVDDLD